MFVVNDILILIMVLQD